jgi:hypothetical protein
MSSNGLAIAQEKMRAAGQPEGAIRSFSRAYELLVGGAETMLASSELEPVDDVAALEQLPPAPGALATVAVIKLNGGLATSMGLRNPKSLRRGARRPLLPRHHRRADAGATPSPRDRPAAAADGQHGDARRDPAGAGPRARA